MSLRYLSVFSGIEAATVAWRPLGWQAVAFSEIELFPCRVLQYHYPEVPNMGDISKVDWRQFYGAVDIVVGGSPCQSFSVAGRREGMAGGSGLVREYFRVLSECKPRWFVWENVPGVVSSNGGADWLFILREWLKLGYHIAYRVLDAQYAGVPQRRRRIFAIGYLGDWRPAAKVLFECYSLQRHPAPCRKTRGTDTNTTQECAFTPGSHAEYKPGIGTLRAAGGDLGGGSETLIAKCLTSRNERYDWETENFVCAPVAFKVRQGKDGGEEDKAFTLSCGHDQDVFIPQSSVRRLTPTEAERLQGFPDGYTNIIFRGKPAPDGARYKALGNSMCVNVMAWIGKRIQMVEDGEL